MSVSDKKEILVKFHRQFGNPTAERLEWPLRSAGVKNTDKFKLLRSVVDNCEI